MPITRIKLWPVMYFNERPADETVPEMAYFFTEQEALAFRKQIGVLDMDLGDTIAFYDSESGQYYEQGPRITHEVRGERIGTEQ